MTDPIATTGLRLKAERERRGSSLQKAADELHLDAWVIDALETEDYQRIGPPVYAKGHLKRYAAFLGLPTAEILAGYESRAQAPQPEAPRPVTVRVRTNEPAASNLTWPQIAGSVGAVLLVLFVLWWKPWHPHGAPASDAPAANSSADAAAGAANAGGGTAASAEVASAAQPRMAPSAAASPESKSPALMLGGAEAGPPPEVAGSGPARLRLSFSADSWVDVHDAAGRRVFAGNGHANSVKTIAGIAPMRVYLGFASGVQLEINDRAVAIGPQFVAGDVARFEAGADGVLRRDSQPRTARPTG